MTTQILNENEVKAFDIIRRDVEMAYTTNEITENVAYSLGISLNAAKGYIGQLTQKGYIEKCKTNVNGKNMLQFNVLK